MSEEEKLSVSMPMPIWAAFLLIAAAFAVGIVGGFIIGMGYGMDHANAHRDALDQSRADHELKMDLNDIKFRLEMMEKRNER